MNNQKILAEYKVGLGIAKLIIFEEYLFVKNLTSSKKIPIRNISHIETRKWTKILVVHLTGGGKEKIQLSKGNSLYEAENLINSLNKSTFSSFKNSSKNDDLPEKHMQSDYKRTKRNSASHLNVKWYHEPAGIILFLILFFPVGLYLMWNYADWSSILKWFITGVLILFFVFIINIPDDISKMEQTTVNNSNTSVETQHEEEIKEPAEPISKEDQIRNIVANQMKGSNNMGKQYVRKIDVVEQENGGWSVLVEYNADDNLTTNLQKTGIETTMSEIYIALYTSNKDVRSVSVAAYFPLVDRYGNESEDVIYKSILDIAEAEKVNWSADSLTLKLGILPEVWTTSILHSEFR